jgi:hypothetical protein
MHIIDEAHRIIRRLVIRSLGDCPLERPTSPATKTATFPGSPAGGRPAGEAFTGTVEVRLTWTVQEGWEEKSPAAEPSACFTPLEDGAGLPRQCGFSRESPFQA